MNILSTLYAAIENIRHRYFFMNQDNKCVNVSWNNAEINDILNAFKDDIIEKFNNFNNGGDSEECAHLEKFNRTTNIIHNLMVKTYGITLSFKPDMVLYNMHCKNKSNTKVFIITEILPIQDYHTFYKYLLRIYICINEFNFQKGILIIINNKAELIHTLLEKFESANQSNNLNISLNDIEIWYKEHPFAKTQKLAFESPKH